MRRLLLSVAFVAMGLCGVSAQAAISSGDFRTESDLPDYSSAGPLVYQNLGASVGAGDELNSSHFVANPSGWGGGVVFMDLDASTNILTLKSQDTWDFQTFTAGISNMSFSAGESITGITMLTNGILNVSLIPTLSFTSNSIFISYNYRPDDFNFTGGTASFQLSLAAPVPEPEIYAMMGLGLGLMGWVSRRRKQQLA